MANGLVPSRTIRNLRDDVPARARHIDRESGSHDGEDGDAV